ncbi:MAG: hypothetical protein GX366_04805 [Epulopiscium sp.]|nr:hypothetical protein [Candidatus Epulonipiscium sp.]
MFSKRQYRVVLTGAVLTFFFIALLIYTIYIKAIPKSVTELPQQEIADTEEGPQENQTVMIQDVVRIKPDTDVTIEIVDQFGLVSQSQEYKGVNWLGYTKPQLAKMFPDYVITCYDVDKVILTKVMERQIDPNYILTINNGNIVISIERSGHKVFYKETGLEQHDLSEGLSKVLDKGIRISTEQKDEILENSDAIYMILQEYDE